MQAFNLETEQKKTRSFWVSIMTAQIETVIAPFPEGLSYANITLRGGGPASVFSIGLFLGFI